MRRAPPRAREDRELGVGAPDPAEHRRDLLDQRGHLARFRLPGHGGQVADAPQEQRVLTLTHGVAYLSEHGAELGGHET
jgi:hypothetical protein